MTWIQRKFGKQSRKKIHQKKEELSSVHGSLKSKETEFLDPYSLHAGTFKFRVNFNKSFAPVINDVSFRIMFIVLNIFGDLNRQSLTLKPNFCTEN
jgi:hypothetical protein